MFEKGEKVVYLPKGEKVIFLPEGKVYDFGYIGSTGKAIIYEEGERNLQDAFAVDVNQLVKLSDRVDKVDIGDTFKKIFEASVSDKKTLEQKALKLAEETGEVAQAILSYCSAHACGYKNKTKEDAIEELIDCIITAGSVIYHIEDGKVDEKRFCRIVDTKLKKWIKNSNRE